MPHGGWHLRRAAWIGRRVFALASGARGSTYLWFYRSFGMWEGFRVSESHQPAIAASHCALAQGTNKLPWTPAFAGDTDRLQL